MWRIFVSSGKCERGEKRVSEGGREGREKWIIWLVGRERGRLKKHVYAHVS